MHPLEKKIGRLIRDRELLCHGDRLVIGVSGGPDSMALLHLLAAVATDWAWSLLAVYVDHGLRPEETGQEAALVQTAADKLGVEFFGEQVDVRREAKKRGLSLEHCGRLLRYEIFERLVDGAGGAKIVVAHTADEQAEEVLLRLIRGTGRKGLAGMEMLRDGQVVRPLLTTAKQELLAYLTDRDIVYAVDSSNRDRRFLRNRVRLDLLPYLAEQYNPNIAETLRQTAVILQDEEVYLAEGVERAWSEVVGTAAGGGSELALQLVRFREQSRAIQRRLLEKACWRCGQRPTFKGIGQLLDLVTTDSAGRRLHLGDGLRAQLCGDQLFLSRPHGKQRWRGDLLEREVPGFVLSIAAPGEYLIPEVGQVLTVELTESVPGADSLTGAAWDWLDADTIRFPLLARSFRPGDRFHPLGAPGRKKVGDFLTDQKVAREQRQQVVVLECAGLVVALLGHRIDHGYRVVPTTRRALKISLQPL